MIAKLAAAFCLTILATTACATTDEASDSSRTVSGAVTAECRAQLDACKASCHNETDLASQNVCNTGCLRRFKKCN